MSKRPGQPAETAASERPAAPTRSAEPPRTGERPDCLCMGLGPELTHFLRGLASSGEMRTAVVEVLKAIRTLADAQIEYLSREPDRKGTKVEVE